MPNYAFIISRNNGSAWLPVESGQVVGTQTDRAAARNWVTSNSATTGYAVGDSVTITELSTGEAGDRGIATVASLGDISDAMASPGGTATVQSKLRFLTMAIDNMNTIAGDMFTALNDANILNSPYSNIVHQKIALTAGVNIEAKAGATRLPGRKGIWIENLITNPATPIATTVYFGDSNVSTTGIYQGLTVNLGDKVFFPVGDFDLRVVSNVNADVIIVEVV
jgi:hypothetical protein